MNKAQFPKPHQILTQALKRKQEKLPSYSLRALSRDVGVSSTFMSKVLAGQKNVPTSRLKKISKSLDMDLNIESYLKQSLLFHSLPSEELRQIAIEGVKPVKMMAYQSLSRKKFSVLSQWYNIAILDLLTCQIEATPHNIAKKLRLDLRSVKQALEALAKEGLAIEVEGVWKKTELKITFPTAKLHTEVNNFHKQMIRKAQDALLQTREKDFESRLITGITIAANPENLELVKKTIFSALAEVASQLSEGPCEEVYQFNAQLFPLTIGTKATL